MNVASVMSNSNNTITVFNNIIVFMLLPEKAEMTIILQKYLKWVLSICVQGSMSQRVSAVTQTHKMKAKILK